MKELIKRWYYKYQRLFFYVGIGNGEFDKPGTALGKVALFSIWIKLFINGFTWQMAVALYFFVLIVLFIIGWISVKSGAYELVQSMSNSNNAEIKAIKQSTEEILKKLK